MVLRVVKKSGYREDYNIEKVHIALEKTAKSIGETFTNSDWRELKPRILARLEPLMEGKDEIFFHEIDDAVSDSLLRSRFKVIAKEYIQSRSRVRQDKLNDLGLSPLSMWLLKERYLKKDSEGNPIETAKEMMCRVATAIANAEKTQQLKEEYSDKFTNLLSNLEFLPSSPCLVSAGNNKTGTLLSCYAFEIEDSIDSIFGILKDSAKIFQMGGGVGISISKLREKGCLIKTSNGMSSGPISFLHLFNTMVDTVKAGGFRRGALLALMHYTHPDIEEFISCKRKINSLNNMNISVMVDDEFFRLIKEDKDINLVSPKTGKITKTIKASLLLEQLSTNIWETGEPGLLFYDRINKDNPTPHLGDLRVCNPCHKGTNLIITDKGKIPIKDLVGKKFKVLTPNGTYENAKAFSTGKQLLWKLATDYNSIDLTSNHKILTDKGLTRLKDINYKYQIKIYNGKEIVSEKLWDWYPLNKEEEVYNITVSDDEHLLIANNIVVGNCAEATLLSMEACVLGSINLTKHIKDKEIDWDKLAETTRLGIRFLDNMIEISPQPTKEISDSVKRTRKAGLGIMGFCDTLLMLGIRYSSKEAIEYSNKIMSFINDVANQYSEELGKEKGLYDAYKEGYRKRRNSIVTTIAPTGSLSLICGVSSGIEPNFAKEYTRVIGDEIVKVSHPSSSDKLFETFGEIPLEQHLTILSEFQKNTENSVSKTCNVPTETSVNEIKNLIIKSWESEVKGITIFREGCNRGALIKSCDECQI